MHDSQMLFNPNDCWHGQAWEIDSVATSLIDKGLLSPIIIVVIWSTDKIIILSSRSHSKHTIR